MDDKYKTGQPIFKEYILISPIGEGAFGRVYLVKRPNGIRFALKVLHRGIEMEQRGVESVKGISSDYLVKVLDYGETVKGEPCILMEYYKDNLRGVIDAGKMDEAQACRCFEHILKGLMVLERHGVMHRDIKPENLFIREGNVKIGDFGTARYTSGDTSHKSHVIGTIQYMAPERFKKSEKYGHPVDRWSAAVVFFRLLTGENPFQGNDFAQISAAILWHDPDMAAVPERYRAFLRKCFHKDVMQRYESNEVMLSAFREIRFSRLHGGPVERGANARQSSQIEVEKMNESCSNRPRKPLLRSKPIKTDSKSDFVLEEIENEYVDNGDGTITDEATGLMWEKSGSSNYMNYEKALKYVEGLNQKKFAKHDDWRLPTMDELWSLMEKEKMNGDLYIDPMFDATQRFCWSADKRSSGSAWGVYFYDRVVYDWDGPNYGYYVRAVRSGQC